MAGHQGDLHEAGMASMADAMRMQTEAFVRAMDAQTAEIKRLSEKVDVMQSRVIRLEEQRHGKDIERLTRSLDVADKRIATLELNWAQARGAGMLMTWAKNFGPLIVAGFIGIMVALGVDLTPEKVGK